MILIIELLPHRFQIPKLKYLIRFFINLRNEIETVPLFQTAVIDSSPVFRWQTHGPTLERLMQSPEILNHETDGQNPFQPAYLNYPSLQADRPGQESTSSGVVPQIPDFAISNYLLSLYWSYLLQVQGLHSAYQSNYLPFAASLFLNPSPYNLDSAGLIYPPSPTAQSAQRNPVATEFSSKHSNTKTDSEDCSGTRNRRKSFSTSSSSQEESDGQYGEMGVPSDPKPSDPKPHTQVRCSGQRSINKYDGGSIAQTRLHSSPSMSASSYAKPYEWYYKANNLQQERADIEGSAQPVHQSKRSGFSVSDISSYQILVKIICKN